MAFTQAANMVEKAIGHGDNATITTDVSNYNNEYGRETGDKILATTWQGKNSVKVGMLGLKSFDLEFVTTNSYGQSKWPSRGSSTPAMSL